MRASKSVREARQEFSVVGWLAVALTLVVLTSAGVARLSEMVQGPMGAESLHALSAAELPWNLGDIPEPGETPRAPSPDLGYFPPLDPVETSPLPWTPAAPRPEPSPPDLVETQGGVDATVAADPDLRWSVRDLSDDTVL